MKRVCSEPLLAWPGWRHWVRTSCLSLLVTAWFVIVYGGADWLVGQHRWRVRVHFEGELSMPLIPGFTLAYLSIYLLFLAVPFVLRRRDEVTALAIRQTVAIAVAGIAFLLLPAQLAYPPATHLGIWSGLFQFADRLNLDYNLVPSLHVALSIITIEACVPHASRPAGTVLRVWGVLIAASTLFTHQHHVLDVAAGCCLGWGMSRVHWARMSSSRRKWFPDPAR